MLDFTSALYLGLRHPSWSLQPWRQLTTGIPAALSPAPGASIAARELATLQGCEAGTLGASTLHLFWDLLGMVPKGGVTIYVDAGTYPVAMWGIERAAARGTKVRNFAHHDPEALRRQLRCGGGCGTRRPLVVSDGFCPGCGRPAPLATYLEIAVGSGGWLLIDDTQALGILGHSPAVSRPYGEGGGGMLRWSSISDSRLLVVSSLAKGFGVPVAALSGSKAFVTRFEELSETRVHCSPPSLAAIHATDHALTVNRTCGDNLRSRLATLVRRFRGRLCEFGFAATGGLFPVQTLAPVRGLDAPALHARLLRAGVATVLHRRHERSATRISFLINARHNLDEIDQATGVLADAATRVRLATAPQEQKHEQPHYV